MKVSHNDDFDTHSVMGGREVMEFGIAQTPEFFEVLSSAMYTNKLLAVIRETVCNAWDSHIASNIRHIPVKVEIDRERIVIRDYGAGIHPDNMHRIYCVYGSSTKVNDGNQTGGFGLGSKSPFAYQTTFTVTTHHMGLKTVYVISRGSAETNGKPDARIMVQVPTTETGIEVMIPLKDASHQSQFVELTKNIAAFGEMNVNLNGKPVTVVPISKAEDNMFLTKRKPENVYHQIAIRYGNVCYPLSPAAEYIDLYQRLIAILDEIPGTRTGVNYATGLPYKNEFCIILDAPKNSISVTPSRESLANTETTFKTVRMLLTNIISKMGVKNQNFVDRLYVEQQRAIDHFYTSGRSDRLFFAENLMTDNYGIRAENTDYRSYETVSSMDELATYYLKYQTNLRDDVLASLMKARIDALIEGGVRRVYDLKKFRKLANARNLHEDAFDKRMRQWFVHPLIKKLVKHETVHPRHLFIVDHRNGRPRNEGFKWHKAAEFNHGYNPDLSFMQNVVIVTHSRMSYQSDMGRYRLSEQLFKHTDARFVYVAPRKEGHREAAVAEFTRLGYFVIDLAGLLEINRIRNEARMSVAEVKVWEPKKKGLVSLKASLGVKGVTSAPYFRTHNHTAPNAERTTKFTHVIKPYNLSANYGQKFFPWGDTTGTFFAKTFGDKIGICVSDTSVQAHIKQGKGDGWLFMAQYIADNMLTNPAIKRLIGVRKGRQGKVANFGTVIDIAEKLPRLKKALKLVDRTSDEDGAIVNAYDTMISHVRATRDYDEDTWEYIIAKTRDIVEKWEPEPSYVALGNTLENSVAMRLLDIHSMRNALDRANQDINLRVFIESTLITALNI